MKIVIIGAGLAGLTMGYRLKQKGYTISIYEAKPRVGGRVHTVFVKNLAYHLRAEQEENSDPSNNNILKNLGVPLNYVGINSFIKPEEKNNFFNSPKMSKSEDSSNNQENHSCTHFKKLNNSFRGNILKEFDPLYEDLSQYSLGRMDNSNTFDGCYSLAELGGQNITDGGEAKHFLNLAKELNLEIEEKKFVLSRGYYTDGILYDSSTLIKRNNFLQNNVQKKLKDLILVCKSMAELMEHLFIDEPLLKRIFTYYLQSYEGLPLKNLDMESNIEILKYFLPEGIAASQTQNRDCDPFLEKNIKGGNSQLPIALAEILEGHVFLNKALKNASREGHQIKLEFADGCIEYCDKLVLSIPCTTYKNISWQDSIIPQENLNLIYNVQYGLNGKIIIPAPSQNPLYYSIHNDHVGTFFNHNNALLTVYTDGIWGNNLNENLTKYYPLMMEMVKTNYEVFDPTLYSSFYPKQVLEENYKKYSGSVYKSWAQDPYAQGSYSAVGTQLGNQFLAQSSLDSIKIKTMFMPIQNKIFFIGEHTSIIPERGTMEAAIESAERISSLF